MKDYWTEEVEPYLGQGRDYWSEEVAPFLEEEEEEFSLWEKLAKTLGLPSFPEARLKEKPPLVEAVMGLFGGKPAEAVPQFAGIQPAEALTTRVAPPILPEPVESIMRAATPEESIFASPQMRAAVEEPPFVPPIIRAPVAGEMEDVYPSGELPELKEPHAKPLFEDINKKIQAELAKRGEDVATNAIKDVLGFVYNLPGFIGSIGPGAMDVLARTRTPGETIKGIVEPIEKVAVETLVEPLKDLAWLAYYQTNPLEFEGEKEKYEEEIEKLRKSPASPVIATIIGKGVFKQLKGIPKSQFATKLKQTTDYLKAKVQPKEIPETIFPKAPEHAGVPEMTLEKVLGIEKEVPKKKVPTEKPAVEGKITGLPIQYQKWVSKLPKEDKIRILEEKVDIKKAIEADEYWMPDYIRSSKDVKNIRPGATGNLPLYMALRELEIEGKMWKPKVRELPSPEEIITEKPAVTEPSVIGLNKAEQNRIRRDLRLDELEPAKRKTWERTLEEAKEGKLDENALTIADEVVKSKRPITDAEHGGMVLKAARLVDEYEARIKDVATYVEKGDVKASQMERTRADVIIDQLDKLTDATRLGRRETARALSIGRMMVNRESYTLAHVVQRAKAAKGSKLSPQENARLEKLTAENSALEATLKEIEAKYEKVLVEKEKGIAQGVAKREVHKARIRERTTTAKEKILSDRTNIKKQLTEMGFRVNDVTGVTTEGAYLVGKLATTYIREGVLTLEGVVRKVLADLPQLTERDVYRSLAMRNHKAQIRAKIEVTRRVARLKNQARLLIEIENAERGIFEPRRTKPIQSAEIKSLQKKLTKLRLEAYRSTIEAARLERTINKINELQDQLANHHRTLRKGKKIDPPELITAKEKLREIRSAMRVEDELVRLNEQLRTGEFEVKPKLEPKVLPPELERKQIELKRARRQIQTAIEEMAPITARKLSVEAINTARTLKATADMSATLRQGLILSVRRPIKAAKNFAKSVRATFSKYTAEQMDHAIRSADDYYLCEKAGLELTELGGKPLFKEEMFMAQVIEKFPVVGEIVKASNRHMTTYLNLMRKDAFSQFLKKYPNATHAELKAWADAINIFSGRGDLGRAKAIANELSYFAFAPRFAVSRVQTPYMFFKYIKMPRVRTEIAKDLVATATLGGTLLVLADLAGFEVGLDPRSPDWGKIRIGDTRIDVWGGCQQPMRLVTRIGLSATDRIGLTGKELSKREKDIDPIELVSRFAAFKLAPAITIPAELIRSRTIVGEERTPLETMAWATAPMVYESLYEAYKLEGAWRAGLVGGLEFFGVSVGTYKDSEWRTRLRIRRMLREGNESGAWEKMFAWNMENPDKKISSGWLWKQINEIKP